MRLHVQGQGSSSRRRCWSSGAQPLQTSRLFNIAHRGSNGELLEETAVAYMRAIDEGADFIEADVAATKDGHLVCFHDMTLDDTTDVADHKEFAARRRTQEVQWANVTGFFISTYPSLKSIVTVGLISSNDRLISNELLLISRS
jgi:glycerophosphoryl diester phosphodiesterase